MLIAAESSQHEVLVGKEDHHRAWGGFALALLNPSLERAQGVLLPSTGCST